LLELSIDEPSDIETDNQETECEMVGWVNQFKDRDQMGAFVIREMNFRALTILGSVWTIYGKISF
jgi:hypothetical protein